MLNRLLIKNFALIRDAEIEFDQGFIVLTGETGSGKSLLVSALSFLAGDRVAGDVVRDGSGKAVVEAEFTRGDQFLILRRELHAGGRTRAFVNDEPTALKELSNQAAALLDLTSQRAFNHLLNPDKRLEFLDFFAGLQSQRERLTAFEREYRDRLRALNELKSEQAELAARREILEYQLTQIDEADPQPGEEGELRDEIKRLEHTEDLHRDGSWIVESITGDDHSVGPRLAEASKKLKRIADLDGSLRDLIEELESAAAAIREISRRVEERCLNIDFQPDELEKLREREHVISGLVRKFGGSFAALLEHRAKLRERLADDRSLVSRIALLERELAELVANWSSLAVETSRIRTERAVEFANLARNSLTKLGVKDAVFEARVERTPDPNGVFHDDGGRWRLNGLGLDSVEFYFSANPGLEPRPVSQVASGGELSRLMLAIKETAPPASEEATVLFDEIDVGVSGAAARLVGEKLRLLSRGRQLVAITHLPQIAGLADQHFRVSKAAREGVTETAIRPLDATERVAEIASLLSDGQATTAAAAQARHLMNLTGEPPR